MGFRDILGIVKGYYVHRKVLITFKTYGLNAGIETYKKFEHVYKFFPESKRLQKKLDVVEVAKVEGRVSRISLTLMDKVAEEDLIIPRLNIIKQSRENIDRAEEIYRPSGMVFN